MVKKDGLPAVIIPYQWKERKDEHKSDHCDILDVQGKITYHQHRNPSMIAFAGLWNKSNVLPDGETPLI